MNTVLAQYGHPVRTKQHTKNPNIKHAVKAEISMKTISLNYSAKRSCIFLTPNSVCLWRHKEHGDSNKCWHQRQFKPSQEDDKWQCVVGINFIMICECLLSCKFYPKLCLASGFTLTKSTRMVTLQDVPLLNVTSGCPYGTYLLEPEHQCPVILLEIWFQIKLNHHEQRKTEC